MAIPILSFWHKYFLYTDEGLGSTYERFIINDILFKVAEHYRIKTAIETPSFGFTGLSGINSMGLAMKKVEMTITDTDPERLGLIKDVWDKTHFRANFDLLYDHGKLPYENNRFDMSWNFSALWFVPDLENFLKEMSRITKRIILIMVPNTTGIGYLFQKHTSKEDIKNCLIEKNIIPKNFIKPLENMGWKLMSEGLIDCPLWPDIGMSKNDLIKKLFAPMHRLKLCNSVIEIMHKMRNTNIASTKPFSHKEKTILNYYLGKDWTLKPKMLRYNFLEKHAPYLIKKIWAHHHYYIFLNVKQTISRKKVI